MPYVHRWNFDDALAVELEISLGAFHPLVAGKRREKTVAGRRVNHNKFIFYLVV